MDQVCVFCDIISGAQAAAVVFEGDLSVGFLDKRPLFHGHCLLVPRTHFATLLDVNVAVIGPLFADVQILARAVEKAMGAQGSFVAVNNKVSQSIPHLHVHVIPRSRKDGMQGFFWPRRPYADDAEMQTVAERIRDAVAQEKARASHPG